MVCFATLSLHWRCKMKTFIGVLLMVAGIGAGLYFGVWWGFIGGIVSVLNAFKATPIESMPVALGIVRVVFAGVIGWGAFAVLFIPGYVMVIND